MPFAARGIWSRKGVCWVRVFEEEGQTPVIVMSELPQNRVDVGDQHGRAPGAGADPAPLPAPL